MAVLGTEEDTDITERGPTTPTTRVRERPPESDILEGEAPPAWYPVHRRPPINAFGHGEEVGWDWPTDLGAVGPPTRRAWLAVTERARG